MFDIKDRVCLITGSYGYLSSAIVEDLCKCGAAVILSGRNENKLNDQYNKLKLIYSNVDKMLLDITDNNNIIEVINSITHKYKRLDILINNANVQNKTKKLEEKEINDIIENYSNNVGSVFNIIKKCIPLMKHTIYEFNGLPSVINLSSIYGSFAPRLSVYCTLEDINPIEYGMSKSSIVQLTKYLACYYGEYNIRFNCISPGPFPNNETCKNKQFIKNLNELVPMKRIGTPEELSGIIIFLASSSSSYITGQNIFVDGGISASV
jgi:NAD(P)-dependent dehydrogenase (short-subunit alcohol dehydrogenase family)